jgi:signal transduction histidine kinase
VTISLAAVEEVAARGRQATLWFAVPAALTLMLLIDLLAQRFVYGPIEQIRGAMKRAAAGDAAARAPAQRDDEIGDVAQGLNRMLERLERVHGDLAARVAQATRDLQAANANLVESHQRVFALREALGRAERMAAIGHIAASVAHQVGTPLNLISGYVQMMKEKAGNTPEDWHRLAIIQVQIQKMSNALRTLLEQTRRPVLQLGAVDMAQLVGHVCEIVAPALEAADVSLNLSVHEPLPAIVADAGQLEVALFNLVSNSLDAMPHGGTLDVTVSPTDDTVRLVCKDTGSGILPELLPRIFEPWVTTKPTGRGTGLGLSITHDTVLAHGGTIDVRSNPGLGTEFIIDLPAAGPAVMADGATA